MTRDSFSISEKELKNSKDLQSTNNGISKPIISNSSGVVSNAVVVVPAKCMAAVSLPGGVLVGAALSLFKQSNNYKSIEEPDSAIMNTQAKL